MDAAGLVKQLLFRMGVHVRRVSDRFLLETDAYYAQAALLRGRRARTVFDVGANLGQTAERYAALLPGATIYSFEPFEESFAGLCRTAERIGGGRVRPQRLAVSDSVGTTRFHTNADHLTNSLLATAPSSSQMDTGTTMRTVGVIEVPTTTLDAFCAAQGVGAIDVLKMDIQGGELMALRGARELLASRSIGLVYTEVNFAPLYQGQAYFTDVAAPLRDAGYSLYGLYNLTHPRGRGLGWGDALFVSPELMPAAEG